jgi:catechol 2,3-dioxygenase-like lactoylglutathione lyase family enzyme
MRIRLTSVFISDIDKALAFYTDVLGFIKKQDIPMGETRFVTLVSPQEPDGTELMLEPNGEHPPTKAFKQALYEEGIPLAAFQVDDLAAEHQRLTDLGVEFRTAPQRHGTESMATLDDTCGNWIMLYQTHTGQGLESDETGRP